MNIYIFGDLEFAHFILNGVTMLYSADGTFIKAAMILSMLYFLWTFIKWSLNPDKNAYPVREWAFGLIFFMIFGGSAIGPKFNVQLIHASTGALRTVADVPLLAAAPSWLSTNLFYELTRKFETSGAFVIPGYEKFRGVNIVEKPDADPLNALVRLHTLSSTTMLPRHIEQNVSTYIQECYIPYLLINNKHHNVTTEQDLRSSLWPQMAVTNVNLTMDKTNPNGEKELSKPCPEFHSEFASGIQTAATTTEGITLEIQKMAALRGIHPTEIRYAAQFINESLTGSADSPNAYTIMTNLFLSRMIKDTLHHSPQAQSLATWSNKMVFEAERKRTFEAAGERSLFMKIYIPTITAIETFSFYIAPILMILSVLGGVGFGLIGKYLMLILFINLWSFIKVFVDIFTALSLSRAFPRYASAGDPTPVNAFAFDTFGQTVAEIESLLTIASNLTMAIPFFAMFLLYGGVHSVMGVMRTIGGGSVDASNMAPTMATSMNAGTYQMGDSTSTLNTAGGYFYKGNTETSLRGSPNVSLTNVASTSSSLVSGAITAKSTSFTNQFAESTQQTDAFKTGWSNAEDSTKSLNFSEMDTNARIGALAYALNKTTGIGMDQATQNIISAAASGEGSVRFGANAVQLFSAGAAAQIKASLTANGSEGFNETNNKTKSALEQWTDQQTNQRSITDARQLSKTDSQSQAAEKSDAYTKSNQAIQALERNNTISTQLQRMSTSMQNILSNSTLSQSAEPVLAGSFDNLINTLKNDYGQYLPAGIDATTLFSEANGFAGNALMNATNQILRHETNANTLDAVSSLWRNAAEQMRDPGNKNSFMTLSRMFEEQGQFLKEQTALSGDTIVDSNNPTGGYDKPAQAFQEKYTPPVNKLEGKINTAQQNASQAIDATGQAIQAGASTITAPSSAPTEIKEDINDSQVKLDNAAKEFEEGRTSRERAFGLIGNVREGMDNVARAIFGQGLRYGENAAENGKIFQASTYNLTNENGDRLTSSRDIGYGMEQLLRYDQANMSNVFSGGTINKDMLAMNDTMRILQSTALDQDGKPIMENGKPVTVGALYASTMTNDDDRNQFLANIGRFDASKEALPEDQRQLLDTLSELKTNGQITSVNANNVASAVDSFNSDSRVERANAPAMARFAEAEVISSKQISPEQSQLILGELQDAGYTPRFNGEQSSWGGAIQSEYAAATSKIAYSTLAEETQIYQQSFAENKIATMLEKGNVNVDYNERERIRSQFYSNIDVAGSVFDKSRNGSQAPSEQSVIRSAENDASSAYKAAIKGEAQDMQYVPLMVNDGVYNRAAEMIEQRTNRGDGARLNTYVNAFTNSEEGRALFNTPDQLQEFINSGKEIIKN